MLQLRKFKYAGQEASPISQDTTLENGEFVKSLSTKIIEDGGALFRELFNVPLFTGQGWDSDDIFRFVVKNQGMEKASADIFWLLLKFPECFPKEIIAWKIPDFDEVVPGDEEILLYRI